MPPPLPQTASCPGVRAWLCLDFMAQYPFSQFTVEPVNAIPTGVYELARWQSSTAVVGHRTRNYSQATTSALWAMTGYNEYYIIEFPDGTYALALFDRGIVADLAKGKAVTLPVSARAGVNTNAKPYLQDICTEYGADLENVVYAFDDDWYKEHSSQILLIRLGIIAGERPSPHSQPERASSGFHRPPP